MTGGNYREGEKLRREERKGKRERERWVVTVGGKAWWDDRMGRKGGIKKGVLEGMVREKGKFGWRDGWEG